MLIFDEYLSYVDYWDETSILIEEQNQKAPNLPHLRCLITWHLTTPVMFESVLSSNYLGFH